MFLHFLFDNEFTVDDNLALGKDGVRWNNLAQEIPIQSHVKGYLYSICKKDENHVGPLEDLSTTISFDNVYAFQLLVTSAYYSTAG